MKTVSLSEPLPIPENVVLSGIEKRPKASARLPQRFKIQEFENPRTGSNSWRVSGIKRDGTRIRENFKEQSAAQCRQIELETEYLRGYAETTIRATKLSAEQVQLAEVAFLKLGDDWQRLLDCVDHWKHTGNKQLQKESPRVDNAVAQFVSWLDDKRVDDDGNVIPGADWGKEKCKLREHSRKGLKIRVNAFCNSIGNQRLNEITIEIVDGFLDGLKNVSNVTRDNYRRAISRFFSWCIQHPRRWTSANPCREIKIDMGEKAPPAILSVQQCKALLKASEPAGLAPYVSVCLFAGLRPFEASRLTWEAVNLKDGEIRIEAQQTKTGRARVVTICKTLNAWLKVHEGKEFFPSNWRKAFDAVKKKAKLTEWPVDVMRHTSISHYFRKTGSYGETAEQFGNSEAIIKNHYQSRVSSDETKQFYALKPAKKAGAI